MCAVIPTTVKKAVQKCEKGTSSKGFQCDKCDFTFTVNGTKIHKGTKNKDSQKPEEFRYELPNKSLALSPVREPREDKTETLN